MRNCMPQDGYGSVSAPEEKIEQAADYKPEYATWGQVLVAGAERLNKDLDSDIGRESGDVDPDALADAVAERLEGSKPLEDMAFEDWFEPDHSQTIARHVAAEIEFGEIELNDRLERIESAAKEATNAAQSAEHAIDNMGGR